MQHFVFGAFEEFHFALLRISFWGLDDLNKPKFSLAAGSVIPRAYTFRWIRNKTPPSKPDVQHHGLNESEWKSELVRFFEKHRETFDPYVSGFFILIMV